MNLLKEEEKLREVVSLVGAEILGDKQRAVFEAVKMLKEYFLLQSAYHPVDLYCPMEKTYKMLELILKFYEKSIQAVNSGIPLADILSLGQRPLRFPSKSLGFPAPGLCLLHLLLRRPLLLK